MSRPLKAGEPSSAEEAAEGQGSIRRLDRQFWPTSSLETARRENFREQIWRNGVDPDHSHTPIPTMNVEKVLRHGPAPVLRRHERERLESGVSGACPARAEGQERAKAIKPPARPRSAESASGKGVERRFTNSVSRALGRDANRSWKDAEAPAPRGSLRSKLHSLSDSASGSRRIAAIFP